MAYVSKDKKVNIQKEKRRLRRQQIRPQKNLAKQSKLSGSRRSICLISLPKSCHLQNCPLMSWCFNKKIHDNVLSFRMAKEPSGSFWAAAYRRMTMQAGGQKKQECSHIHPNFLKATLKAMDKRHAKRKGAPMVKTAKPRRRLSDEEIFYRLAKRSGKNTKTLHSAARVSALTKHLAGKVQPVVG